MLSPSNSSLIKLKRWLMEIEFLSDSILRLPNESAIEAAAGLPYFSFMVGRSEALKRSFRLSGAGAIAGLGALIMGAEASRCAIWMGATTSFSSIGAAGVGLAATEAA